MDNIASDYINVTLIAKTSIKARTFASDVAPVFDSFVAGDIVGKVFSWVMRGASVWWMFDAGTGKSYFVKHEENIFKWSDSDNEIIRQNIISRGGNTEQLDKEQRNKNLKSIGVKIAGSLAIAYATKKIIDKTF